MQPGRITFSGHGATFDFCVGDVVRGNTGAPLVVVTMNHAEAWIRCERATWWRRAWYWLRFRVQDVEWCARCWWADLRGEG